MAVFTPFQILSLYAPFPEKHFWINQHQLSFKLQVPLRSLMSFFFIAWISMFTYIYFTGWQLMSLFSARIDTEWDQDACRSFSLLCIRDWIYCILCIQYLAHSKHFNNFKGVQWMESMQVSNSRFTSVSTHFKSLYSMKHALFVSHCTATPC